MTKIGSTNTSRQKKNDQRSSGTVGGAGFVLYNREILHDGLGQDLLQMFLCPIAHTVKVITVHFHSVKGRRPALSLSEGPKVRTYDV